jgi:hypothetical protein
LTLDRFISPDGADESFRRPDPAQERCFAWCTQPKAPEGRQS